MLGFTVPHHITPGVMTVGAGLVGALAVGTAFIWGRAAARPGQDHGELKLRIRTWWIIVGLLLGSLWLGRTPAIVFFGFVSFLALKEFLSIIPTRRADRRVLFWVYLALILQYVIIAKAQYELFLLFIPVFAFLAIPIRMITIGDTKDFLRALSTIQWGLMTTTFSLSHLAFLLVLPQENNPAGGGAGLVLFVVLLTEVNDVAQYVWGKSLGRVKVIPRISPNKTLAGLLGGIATTASLAAVVAPGLTPLTRPEAAVCGVLLGLCGFFGDVSISALKRDLGIKDSGAMLPGHGGILDRVDSLTYTAPIMFYLIKYLHYSVHVIVRG